MLSTGRKNIAGNFALRAILALALLVLAAVQPGLAATAPASGSKAHDTARHHAKAPEHGGVRVHEQHPGDHVHDKQAENTIAADHGHAGQGSSDACCDVHCAPADAVAVGFQHLTCQAPRGFTPSPAAILVDGTFAELTRPPMHLN